MIKDGNIYYRARLEASKHNAAFSNRQRAADRIYISSEALADYESGDTIPPCDVVQRMIDVYGTDWLRGEHLTAHCPLMYEAAADTSELRTAALGWAVQLNSAEEIGREFAKVAYDGRVEYSEISQAQAIRAKAVELTKVMQATIAAIDHALRRQ
ncbi:MAG TPA: hypothetical protein IAC59_01005 [Candidatus Fimadaptatus faecigallinarum]|uniref:Uncharacterized protein n=1 Tax=Candidatus Fimadaptatus faecigallinarum TaxID=2840814 RepID=A0A9D1LPX4_9FIRM|nr:hypothetical protein [Candidatus Fimadaptatus faecigallinarum]